MTIDASTSASDNEAATPKGSDLRFDRTYAIVAMHAAQHMTCASFAPLRKLLIGLLIESGYSPKDSGLHADDLISVARGVIVSVEADEPRTIPWPGGQQMDPYAEVMYEMETSR